MEVNLMDKEILRSTLKIGETVAVEFKRCGNGIESAEYNCKRNAR